MFLGKKIVLLAFLLGCIALEFSCIKRQSFSPTPEIAFKAFEKLNGDSANFIITFKDGDGNIGLNPWDTTGDFAPTGKFHYNLTMRYFYKKGDGSFEEYWSPQTDTLTYLYRVPDITPIGQNKSVDGDIQVTLSPPYYIPGHSVIKFEVFIYDRELNKSNVIETPEITVP